MCFYFIEPSGAPRNVTVSAVPGRKELFVKWRELQCFETNGKLNKYVVYFAAENSTLKSLDVSPDSTVCAKSRKSLYIIMLLFRMLLYHTSSRLRSTQCGCRLSLVEEAVRLPQLFTQ